MDPLSDVLQKMHLSGSAYFCSDFGSPWGMEVSEGNKGVFHIVVRGNAFIRRPGESESVALNGGDIIAFPTGGQHWLGCDRAGKGGSTPSLEVVEAVSCGNSPFPPGEQTTTLMCGYFDLDRGVLHPLLKSLPCFIHVRSEDMPYGDWLSQSAARLVQETRNPQPGSALISDRLTEVFVIELLRYWVKAQPDQMGFFKALQHPQLGKVITQIHEQPGFAWTVENLAGIASLSRASFAAKFTEYVGETPLNYVAAWRIELAKSLLAKSHQSILHIALEVGYGSEAAFAKAFKRITGLSPGQYRKNIR